jgi:ribosome recycling factor
MNDGKVIRIAIPPLTEERRKELVKIIRRIEEEYKISIRSIRRDTNEFLKSMKKDGEITEDEFFKAQTQIQKITDEYIQLANNACQGKEKEILEF